MSKNMNLKKLGILALMAMLIVGGVFVNVAKAAITSISK